MSKITINYTEYDIERITKQKNYIDYKKLRKRKINKIFK